MISIQKDLMKGKYVKLVESLGLDYFQGKETFEPSSGDSIGGIELGMRLLFLDWKILPELLFVDDSGTTFL